MREINKVISYDDLRENDIVLLNGTDRHYRTDMAQFLGYRFRVITTDSGIFGKTYTLMDPDTNELYYGDIGYSITLRHGKSLTNEHLKLILLAEKDSMFQDPLTPEPKFKLGDSVSALGTKGIVTAVIQRKMGHYYEIHNRTTEPEIFEAPETMMEAASPEEVEVLVNVALDSDDKPYYVNSKIKPANLKLTFDFTGKNIIKAEIL